MRLLQGDRFIPNRATMDVEACQFDFSHEASAECGEEVLSSPKANYQRVMKSALINESSSKILAFKQKAPAAKEDLQNELRVIYSQNKQEADVKKSMRHIPSTADRILDAPEFRTDFYLNLVDWSSTNVVSVALGDVSNLEEIAVKGMRKEASGCCMSLSFRLLSEEWKSSRHLSHSSTPSYL